MNVKRALDNAIVPPARLTDDVGWKGRHATAAMSGTLSLIRAHQAAGIMAMLRALAIYADAHKSRYSTPIGQDGVLGKAWAQSLGGVRALLNGELNGLDGGTIDGAILAMARAAGFEEKDLIDAGLE